MPLSRLHLPPVLEPRGNQASLRNQVLLMDLMSVGDHDVSLGNPVSLLLATSFALAICLIA